MKKRLIVLMLVSTVSISLIVLEFASRQFATHHKTLLKSLREPDKHIGWRGIPNKEGYIAKEGIPQYVKMNSHGFRDKERTYEKRKGTFRILVLGDSMTEGLEVPLERTFPYLLEKKLNSESSKEFEVINLGMSGFGTDQEYLTLKHYGLKYHPDLVILAFLDRNDVWDNFFEPREKALRQKPFFVLNNGRLVKIPFKIKVTNSNKNETHANQMSAIGDLQILKDFLARIFPNVYYSLSDKINEKPWLANFLHKLGIKNSKPKPKLLNKPKENRITVYNHNFERCSTDSPEWQKAWNVTKALILRISKGLKENNTRFLFVIIPARDRFMSYSLNKCAIRTAQANFNFEKQELVVPEFLEENGINYLQLFPGLQKYISHSGNTLYFGDNDSHWNTTGHGLVTKLIYEKLKKDKLLPIEVKKLEAKAD